jgi:hypothetical protein
MAFIATHDHIKAKGQKDQGKSPGWRLLPSSIFLLL